MRLRSEPLHGHSGRAATSKAFDGGTGRGEGAPRDDATTAARRGTLFAGDLLVFNRRDRYTRIVRRPQSTGVGPARRASYECNVKTVYFV